jgi:hypothetical protein
MVIADGASLNDDTIAGVKVKLVAPVTDGRIAFDVSLSRESAPEPPAS